MTLKPFFALVTVRHDKKDPCSVSDYEFYVVAPSERRARFLLKKEVESYRHVSHSITIEEMTLYEEHLRSISTSRLEYQVVNKLLRRVKQATESEKRRLDNRSWSTKDSVALRQLIKDPERFYCFLKRGVTPHSKIILHGGNLIIYQMKREDTLAEMDEKRIRKSVNKELLRGLDEKITSLREGLLARKERDGK